MSAGACTFQQVLDRAVRLCGFDPATLPATLAADFASWLEARVRDAWILARWPGTLVMEERAYAPRFALATVYADGDVVYDDATNAYYEAHEDGFSGRPVTDGAYWTALGDFDRALALEESGETPIGEVLGVWRTDPRKGAASPVGYTLLSDEAWCDPQAPATVWVLFRLAPPVFTATPYAAGTTYFAGDAAFGLPHSYLALRETTGTAPPHAATWRPQLCPAVLADWAARGAKADWLASDGQEDKAAAQESLARGWLNDRLADLTIHQGQAARYLVTP